MIALESIAGLLLAGGQSKRFGAEKAMAPFRGAPLMDRVASAFAPLPRHAVSARAGSLAEQHAHACGATVLYDAPDAPSGPLAGVAAGLAWAAREGFAWLATAPCDAPLLPSDFVPRLADAIGHAPAAFAVTAEGEHPLCALWSVALLAPLESRLAAGEHPSIKAFLQQCGGAAVRFEEARAFANANTADALAALELRS